MRQGSCKAAYKGRKSFNCGTAEHDCSNFHHKTIMSMIDALYIYDDQKYVPCPCPLYRVRPLTGGNSNPIVEQVYRSRPPSAQYLLSLYRSHPAARPSLLYLPDASPPITVFSIQYSNILLLVPSHNEVDPVAVLEFLHRVVDIFEEFLGAPLLSSKIESNYDIVAQLLGEICDAGIINNTEANALRDSVETQGLLGKLFTGVGLSG